jgi:hypothetical protein
VVRFGRQMDASARIPVAWTPDGLQPGRAIPAVSGKRRRDQRPCLLQYSRQKVAIF